MKILIVRMWPYEINIDSYNCQEIGLAKSLIKKQNTCDIVLYTSKNSREVDYLVDGGVIHIYYLRAKNILKNCFYEKKLFDIIKKYDVVQSSEYDQIANVKLYKLLKEKLVIYHGPYESSYNKGYPKKCFISDVYYLFHPSYKNVKCLAKSKLAEEFLKKKGFKRIKTIGVGIDISRFIGVRVTDRINKKIELIKQEKSERKLEYLLYVGKLEDRRNIPLLLDIIEQCKINNKKIKLIIVGNGTEEYKDYCLKIIEKKEIRDYIIYFESLSQEELKDLYSISDVFLLPTQYEIFGMVLLEAIYFGIPIITTKNGGSSFLIDSSEKGVIIDTFDPEKWYEQTIDILQNKKKHDINIEYSWDNMANEFIKTYSEKN